MSSPPEPARPNRPIASPSAALVLPHLPPQAAAVLFPRGADWSASPVPVGAASLGCFAYAFKTVNDKPFKPSMGTLPMLGFATMFGAAAYVLARGESDNGASTATAWSLTYSLVNFVPSLRSWRGNRGAAMLAFVPWSCLFVYGTRTVGYHLG